MNCIHHQSEEIKWWVHSCVVSDGGAIWHEGEWRKCASRGLKGNGGQRGVGGKGGYHPPPAPGTRPLREARCINYQYWCPFAVNWCVVSVASRAGVDRPKPSTLRGMSSEGGVRMRCAPVWWIYAAYIHALSLPRLPLHTSITYVYCDITLVDGLTLSTSAFQQNSR